MTVPLKPYGLAVGTVNLKLSSVHVAFGRHPVLMEGYGYRWFRVGGLDYLLRRTEI